MTTNPNLSQVGGNHYQSVFQHWDFVNTVLHGRYLEGCVTKYMRWRKKNGVQDLKKAVHYIDKIISLYDGPEKFPNPLLRVIYCRWTPSFPSMMELHRRDKWNTTALMSDVSTYSHSNELTLQEAVIVSIMATWDSQQDLARAKSIILNMIDDATKADV